jgi:multidrug efflux pump
VGKGPQYSNLDYTDIYSKQLDAIYRSYPETDATFVVSGYNGLNSSISGMILKPWEQRTRSVNQLTPLVQAQLSNIAGMNVFAFNLPPLPGSTGGLPVQMVISSTASFDQVFKMMEAIKKKARESGMFIVIDSDLDYNSPVVHVGIDRSKANDLGITMQTIGDTLALLVGENYVNRFNLNGRSYEVIPQVPRSDRLTPQSLARYFVKTSSGDSVPLSTVVKVSTGIEPNALSQYNQLNSATFSAVPMPGVTMGKAVAFLEQTAKEILPSDFTHDYLSESRQYVREGNQLTITIAFALIIIYLVLAAQFESLLDPLVILISVPMSMCGALLPLFIGLATLNVYTQVGLVTLIGLISKHGILMTEFANQLQRNEKLDRRTAIERAAQVRLRPILMTTAAMVVGLVPLIFATDAGAASRFSIGLVIVAGMSIGTLFTLFVLPAVYTYLAKDHAAAAVAPRVKEIAEVS